MKTFKIIAASSLVLLAVMQGCKKEEIEETNNPVNPGGGSSSINAFFTQNGVQSQFISVNVATGGYVAGNKGTSLYIPANAFVTLSNQAVTGTIQLELKEILSRTDMLLSDAQTISNGQILESGGELYLDAKQNGQELKLASGKSINVTMPTTTTQTMNLFYGNRTNTGVNWSLANSTPIAAAQDSISGLGWTYPFTIDSLKWINCDKYYSDPRPKTHVKVTLPAGYDKDNTAVFVVISGIKSIIRLYDYENGVFETTYQLPIGLSVSIVAIADKDQLYSAVSQISIANNHNEILNFSTTTASVFQTTLNSLP